MNFHKKTSIEDIDPSTLQDRLTLVYKFIVLLFLVSYAELTIYDYIALIPEFWKKGHPANSIK